MSECNYNYIWRCAKCSNHFVNITKMEGVLKQEKKCPKCKALNIITLGNKEIFIHCKFLEQNVKEYEEDFRGNYQYPD